MFSWRNNQGMAIAITDTKTLYIKFKPILGKMISQEHGKGSSVHLAWTRMDWLDLGGQTLKVNVSCDYVLIYETNVYL